VPLPQAESSARPSGRWFGGPTPRVPRGPDLPGQPSLEVAVIQTTDAESTGSPCGSETSTTRRQDRMSSGTSSVGAGAPARSARGGSSAGGRGAGGAEVPPGQRRKAAAMTAARRPTSSTFLRRAMRPILRAIGASVQREDRVRERGRPPPSGGHGRRVWSPESGASLPVLLSSSSGLQTPDSRLLRARAGRS